jgi:hypothetical protein
MDSVRIGTHELWHQLARMGRCSLLTGLALLASSSTAYAQPLSWSPNRDPGARPMRSLAELAAERESTRSSTAQQALLIRNPDTSDGTPEYALADQFGQVQRYVEPTPGVDLAPYVGDRVTVRSDTGTTLLASQLGLPSVSESVSYNVVQAQHQTPAVRRAPTAPPASPAHRTAQVAPVVVDQYGMTSGAGACNCPNCTVNHYGAPASGGFITPYDACNNCQTYTPYYTTPDTSYGVSCGRGSRGRFYGSAEYLLWWFDGMHTPPLVTGSPAGTPQAQAGVLGQPNTQVLFGDGDILGGSRDGLRFTAGAWINDYQDIAVEGDIFYFKTESVGFSATGTGGVPILARPFFNMVPLDGLGDVLPPAEDAELVSFPGIAEGTVSVDTRSEFRGAGLRLRGALCCKELGGVANSYNACTPAVGPVAVSRIDVIGGYRYLSLDERILIRENLRSLLSTDPGTFDIQDRFDTSNEFHGGDLGFVWEWESSQWSLELLSKMAIGRTNQRVNVRGQTTVGDAGASFTEQGGLLALRSNIGSYQRDVFTVVPELGVTVGYKITPRLRATAGYTLLYWSRVARPGDHIDLDVNPNLLPPVIDPVVGPERPRFAWDDTALLAHGLNLGLDYRF